MSRFRDKSNIHHNIVPLRTVEYYSKLVDGATEYYNVPYGPITDTIDASLTETMTDTIGKKQYYNNVVHSVSSPLSVHIPSVTRQISETGDPIFRIYKSVCTGGPCYVNPRTLVGTNDPSLPSIDWFSMVSKVGDYLNGTIVTKTNIIVTLGEFMKTIAMIKSPYKAIRQFARSGSSSLKDISKVVASAHLETKYGWKQIVRDVIAIAKVYDQVDKHMKYLEEHVGKLRPLSASQVDTVPSTESGSDLFGYSDSVSITCYQDEIKRTARFSLTHVLDEAVLAKSKLEHALYALGVNKLVDAVWDLVPYSFVVDWVVHFDRIFGAQLLNWNSHDIRRMGYSVKTEHSYHAETSMESGTTWDGNTSVETWEGPSQVCYKTFLRTAGFPPDTSSAGIFSGLTKTNLVDGAALILQRI